MSRRKSAAIFLFMGIAFGSAFPAIKAGLADAPPLLFAALRFYVAAVLLVGVSLVLVGEWRPRDRAGWFAVLAGGTFTIGGTGFLYLGQQYTTSGASAIIYSLGPVLTVLLGWLLLPTERASRRDLVGVVVGLFGVFLVVSPTPDALLAPDVVGKGLVLVAIVSVTVGSLLIRRSGTHMPALTMTAWNLGIGALVLHAGSLALGETQLVPTHTEFLVLLAYLVAVPSVLGFALYFALLERSGALQANLVVYVVPVVAVLIGWIWLGETLTPLTLIGFVVIAVGFVALRFEQLVGMASGVDSRVDPGPKVP